MAPILREAEKLECIHTSEFAWVRHYLTRRQISMKMVMLKNIDNVETAVWEGDPISYQFRYYRETGACWFSMQIHAHYAAPAESLFEFFIPPKERDFRTILAILDTI